MSELFNDEIIVDPRIQDSTRRIRQDRIRFRKKISGHLGKNLRKSIEKGEVFRHRGKGKDPVIITVPRIDIPHFKFGKTKHGVGRGEGEPGSVVGQDPSPGKGNGAGQGEGELQRISFDFDYVLKYLGKTLKLPEMKPREGSQIYEEEIVYNSMRKTGPTALLHRRKTMREALLRTIAEGTYDPDDPNIVPIERDFRYRSWKTRQKPTSQAVCIFMRDWSGSMDDTRCGIATDLAWWLDSWIKKSYKKTDSLYIGHDTEAQVVDINKFYEYRYGGGTSISSAFKLAKEKIELLYPPKRWNIYIYYFTDGDNWGDDNSYCISLLKELGDICNVIGVCQIMPYSYGGDKMFLDHMWASSELNSLIQSGILRTYNLLNRDQMENVLRQFLYEKDRLKIEEGSPIYA